MKLKHYRESTTKYTLTYNFDALFLRIISPHSVKHFACVIAAFVVGDTTHAQIQAIGDVPLRRAGIF